MSYTKAEIQAAIEAVEKNMPIVCSVMTRGALITYGHQWDCPWQSGGDYFQRLSLALGFQTREEAIKKIEEFEHLADELRKDWGIGVEPAKASATDDERREIHNPKCAPADKLPKGRRFMRKDEIHDRPLSFPDGVIWKWETRGWSKSGWLGAFHHETYCVPIDFKD